jgi:asparagine synthase (glutamine-hydrolysing)
LEDKNIPAPDLARAASAAEKLGLNLKIVRTNLDELEKLLPDVIKAIGRADPVHVGIAAALWPAIAEAKKDGLKYFMTGLGTEQIYAGGEKYRKISVAEINDLCWQQIGEIIWQGDISRDRALEKYFNFKMLVPYLSVETITAAMRVSGELKNKACQKYDGDGLAQKYILRVAAEELGLPVELAWRRNRPTQYGSKFDKGLEQLARKNGFGKIKQEYLKSISA